MQSVHKRCSKCKVTKPGSEFYADRRTKDGLQYRCKPCFLQKSTGPKKPRRTRAELAEIARSGIRQCTVCKHHKPNTEEFFVKLSAAKGGLAPRCLTCQSRYRRSERFRVARNAKLKDTLELAKRAVAMAKWHAAHPERLRAYRAVAKAKRQGVLTPEPCSVCGKSQNVQAHHTHGYDQENWLRIQWLCRSCHVNEHYGDPALLV
jgi:hypothetical protein